MYRARNVDNATTINGMLFGTKHGTTAKVKTEKAADKTSSHMQCVHALSTA